MITRRTALALGAGAIASALARTAGARTPEEIAADESFWFDVQNAFTVDRS